MKVAILVVVLCALFSVTVAVPQCANPFWARRSGFFATVNQLLTPAPKPVNTGICPDIPDGQDSCCDQGVYNAINAAFLIGRLQILDAQKAIEDAAAKLGDLRPYIDQLQDAISNAPNLTDDQKDTINSAIDDLWNALTEFADAAGANWAQCATGILRYYAGLFCYACTPNWDQYIIISGNDITVLWDLDTCVKLKGDCIPFLQSIHDAVQKILDAFTKIQTLFNANAEPINLRDLCDGDCPDYICVRFIVGYTYEYGVVNTVAGTDTGSNDPTVGKRIKEHSGYTNFMNLLNKIMPDSGNVVSDAILSVTNAAQNAHDAHIKIARNLYNLHKDTLTRQTSGTTSSTYQSNGYPAYSVGANSGLDTQVDSAASLSSWLNFLW